MVGALLPLLLMSGLRAMQCVCSCGVAEHLARQSASLSGACLAALYGLRCVRCLGAEWQ